MTNETQTITKTVISQAEFNKKVEIEFAYLTYMNRLPRDVANNQAIATVSEKFTIQKF